MKVWRISGLYKAALALVLAVLVSGCGDMQGKNIPYFPPQGNIEGFVYAPAGGAGRQAMVFRVAGRDVPAGYEPVEGAQVTILNSDFSDTTGADGRFFFENVPNGVRTIQVSKNGSTTSFQVTVQGGKTVVANDSVGDENLVIQTKGSLEGYVYTKVYNENALARSAGRTTPEGCIPLEGATVAIKDTTLSATTGADGKFSFQGVPGGTQTVFITNTGAATATVQIAVVPGTTTVANDAAGDSALTLAPSPAGALVVTATAVCQNLTTAEAKVHIKGPGQSQFFSSGKSTPAAAFTDIAPGVYSVKLVSSQYLPADPQDVTITANSMENISFSLTPSEENTNPYAQITGPANNATFSQGATVSFSGAGSDCEDGTITGAGLAWSSDIDGALGTGSPLQVSSLSRATHTITLTVTDSGGKKDTASITLRISVNTAPTAEITAPAGGGSYEQGQRISFAGAASDDEDILLSGSSLAWTSSLDGALGTGNALNVDDLSNGNHTITLTATDSGGKTGKDTISLSVVQSLPPTATIFSPMEAASFNLGVTILFAGTASDGKDGTLTGSALKWTSSIDGNIGSGATFATDSLSSGNHTITLTATDSDGSTGAATRHITVSSTVQKTAPNATILTPAGGATFSPDDLVTFTGIGLDAEDGPLPAAQLAWASTIDGPLGTGTTLRTDELSSGLHTISLTVTDSDSMTDQAAINITISSAATNEAPSPVIASPVNNSTVSSGATVWFVGTATDPEDNVVTGTNLVWESDLDGRLGTGAALMNGDLSEGVHTITLTATDSGGETGATSVKITVE